MSESLVMKVIMIPPLTVVMLANSAYHTILQKSIKDTTYKELYQAGTDSQSPIAFSVKALQSRQKVCWEKSGRQAKILTPAERNDFEIT